MSYGGPGVSIVSCGSSTPSCVLVRGVAKNALSRDVWQLEYTHRYYAGLVIIL